MTFEIAGIPDDQRNEADEVDRDQQELNEHLRFLPCDPQRGLRIRDPYGSRTRPVFQPPHGGGWMIVTRCQMDRLFSSCSARSRRLGNVTVLRACACAPQTSGTLRVRRWISQPDMIHAWIRSSLGTGDGRYGRPEPRGPRAPMTGRIPRGMMSARPWGVLPFPVLLSCENHDPRVRGRAEEMDGELQRWNSPTSE